MAAASRIPDHFCRLAGCFLPEDVAILDAAFDAVIRELRTLPHWGATDLDSPETRTWIAAAVISSAKRGELEAAALTHAALQSLAQGLPGAVREAG